MQGVKSAIWGAGGTGRKLLHEEEVEKLYDISCFIDMDAGKWGGNLEGIPILSPEDALERMKINCVIVASLPGYNFIMDYLKRKEFPLANIVTKFVDQPLISRIQFIHDLRTVFAGRGIEGACAEAGVFEGDFAKHINECFLESRLYLFDTFSGFDSKDIEKEGNLSMAKAGDYGFTSEELVMSKMKYPDMV